MDIKGYESNSVKNLQSYKQSIIENFKLVEKLVNIGGKEVKTNIDETIINNLTENTQNITNEMRVNAVSKLMTVAINEAAQNNKADLVSLLSASNRLSISNANVSGDFVIDSVNQASTVDSKVDGEIVQNLQSKITNEFTKNISKVVSQKLQNIQDIKNSVQTGTEIGNMVNGALDSISGVANNFVDNVAQTAQNIFDFNIGGTREEKNIKKNNITNTIKDTLELETPLNIDDTDDISDDIKNLLSQENMSKCAADAATENNIDISNATVGGNMKLSNINQTAVMTSAIKCTFNQTVISEMATKIVNNIDKVYEQIAEQIKTNESEEKSGDLLAIGEAGKAILVGAGEGIATAAVGAGDGFATAAEGTGKGVATASTGIGDGLSKVTDSLMWPLIIAGISVGIGLIIYLIIRFGGGSSDENYEEYEEDY
ncbi:hypothetical protein crov090 [Cafeteria roenbergensis virus]|uniref:Uncharacterized protein n=1 Tax=Cafeteria roenbergensis virus (strain BV-PW1) TaxID=693272 RepID=E3T4L0_CROVB|nr:hypothetical protein crov090 [Cafeteria roenbergensis virus BV-PW1]ADO67123.1 hypothetical protein crov090 [Cafeteria roenbergensis virus BV-PW1]